METVSIIPRKESRKTDIFEKEFLLHKQMELLQKVCPKFGSKCKFGDRCHHQSFVSRPSPPKYAVDYEKYKYPKAESHLGEPVRSTCGYSYDHCISGYLFGSSILKECEAFCMPQIKITQCAFDSLFSIGEFEMYEQFKSDESPIWGKMLCELYQHTHRETLHTTFLSKKYPRALDTYKKWLETLVLSCKEKPSEKHFLIIICGLDKEYECDKVKYESFNPSAPGYSKSFWCERWPTKDEIASMILHFKDFHFGVPPVSHLHGN